MWLAGAWLRRHHDLRHIKTVQPAEGDPHGQAVCRTLGTGVSAIGISPPRSWLFSSPYKCLRDIHVVPSRRDRRPAVKFVAEVERFTDSETECVIVGTGQNPIARIVTRGHGKRLQAGRYRMAEISYA
jgi:hypothetical protein